MSNHFDEQDGILQTGAAKEGEDVGAADPDEVMAEQDEALPIGSIPNALGAIAQNQAEEISEERFDELGVEPNSPEAMIEEAENG